MGNDFFSAVFGLMFGKLLKYWLIGTLIVASLIGISCFFIGRASAELTEKRVILFHASWCKYCPSQIRIVKSVEAKGYKVRYVDIDKEKAITQHFRVTGVPLTLIVQMDGSDAVEHKRFSGQTSPDVILKALK